MHKKIKHVFITGSTVLTGLTFTGIFTHAHVEAASNNETVTQQMPPKQNNATETTNTPSSDTNKNDTTTPPAVENNTNPETTNNDETNQTEVPTANDTDVIDDDAALLDVDNANEENRDTCLLYTSDAADECVNV